MDLRGPKADAGGARRRGRICRQRHLHRHPGEEERLVQETDLPDGRIVFGKDEIHADVELAGFHGEFSIEKLVFVEKFPQPERVGEIEQAGLVQIADVIVDTGSQSVGSLARKLEQRLKG